MQFLSSLNIRYRHIHLKETDGGKRVNKSMCKCLIDYWEIFWMTCIIHWIFMENFRYVYLRQDNKIGEGFRSFVWNYSMEELLLLFSNLCLWYLGIREREKSNIVVFRCVLNVEVMLVLYQIEQNTKSILAKVQTILGKKYLIFNL